MYCPCGGMVTTRQAGIWIWCNKHGSAQGFQLTSDRPRVVVGLFDVAHCLIVSLPKLEAIDRLELGT